MSNAFVFRWITDDGQPWDYHLVAPMSHWSANNSEAQVAAMQAEGPDRSLGPGHRAYGEWLHMIQPEVR